MHDLIVAPEFAEWDSAEGSTEFLFLTYLKKNQTTSPKSTPKKNINPYIRALKPENSILEAPYDGCSLAFPG